MSISDEAVEAAREQLEAMGIYLSPKYARSALEAAVPFIAAQALENAADAVDEDLYDEHDPFYVGWLKARAENIRENGTDQTECDECVTHRTTPPDTCPIAYDHMDDLDVCAVCGWGASVEQAPSSGPKDMTNMTGPQRIQEAIDRVSGRYAPTRPMLFRCGGGQHE